MGVVVAREAASRADAGISSTPAKCPADRGVDTSPLRATFTTGCVERGVSATDAWASTLLPSLNLAPVGARLGDRKLPPLGDTLSPRRNDTPKTSGTSPPAEWACSSALDARCGCSVLGLTSADAVARRGVGRCAWDARPPPASPACSMAEGVTLSPPRSVSESRIPVSTRSSAKVSCPPSPPASVSAGAAVGSGENGVSLSGVDQPSPTGTPARSSSPARINAVASRAAMSCDPVFSSLGVSAPLSLAPGGGRTRASLYDAALTRGVTVLPDTTRPCDDARRLRRAREWEVGLPAPGEAVPVADAPNPTTSSSPAPIPGDACSLAAAMRAARTGEREFRRLIPGDVREPMDGRRVGDNVSRDGLPEPALPAEPVPCARCCCPDSNC